MSDVRAELAGVIRQGYRACSGNQMSLLEREQLADAILARFAVTPKPVVSDEDLGKMVHYAYSRSVVGDQGSFGLRGRCLQKRLTEAGLIIVRTEEARR